MSVTGLSAVKCPPSWVAELGCGFAGGEEGGGIEGGSEEMSLCAPLSVWGKQVRFALGVSVWDKLIASGYVLCGSARTELHPNDAASSRAWNNPILFRLLSPVFSGI